MKIKTANFFFENIIWFEDQQEAKRSCYERFILA